LRQVQNSPGFSRHIPESRFSWKSTLESSPFRQQKIRRLQNARQIWEENTGKQTQEKRGAENRSP
jgi:hypothetical protein